MLPSVMMPARSCLIPQTLANTTMHYINSLHKVLNFRSSKILDTTLFCKEMFADANFRFHAGYRNASVIREFALPFILSEIQILSDSQITENIPTTVILYEIAS